MSDLLLPWDTYHNLMSCPKLHSDGLICARSCLIRNKVVFSRSGLYESIIIDPGSVEDQVINCFIW